MRRGTIWVIAAVAVAVLVPNGAAAGSDCATVKGTSHGTTSVADFFGTLPFEGIAELRTSAGNLTAEVVTFLTGLPVEHGNATFAPTSHCFLVLDEEAETVGAFCTTDRAVLAQTGKPGLLRLNSKLHIDEGQWMGSPASGKLVVNGILQVIPGDPIGALTTWKIKGRICSDDP